MSEDAVKRPKDPSEYGKKKYAVELFLTERYVVTVYADSPEQAIESAQASPYRTETGLQGFLCAGGVSHTHFDEDFDFKIMKGAVIDNTEEDD